MSEQTAPKERTNQVVSWGSAFRSLVTLIALVVMMWAVLDHHDHWALYAAFVALSNIGAEVFSS